MLTDKQYLLLCELADMDILNIETGSIGEIIELLHETDEFGQNAVINEAAESFRTIGLKLNLINRFEDIVVYVFSDCDINIFVISAKKMLQGNNKTSNEIVDFIESNMGTGQCIVTGYESGGVYALYVASRLEIEGILFKVTFPEEPFGNVKSYVSENEPVSEYTEKLIFVKQKSEEINPDFPFSQILLFDEYGNVVIGKQSEYSKFCSWFYNTAGKIDNDIWNLFFKDANEDFIFEDKDLYSVYLKVNELNCTGIKSSMKNTLKYIETELDKNRCAMRLEFEKNIFKIDVNGFNVLIGKFAENTNEIVKSSYRSVETILMGVGIFALGKHTSENVFLMEQFSKEYKYIIKSIIHIFIR